MKKFSVIRDYDIVEIIEIDGLVVHRYSNDGIDSHISLWDLNESDFANFLDDIEILASFDTLEEAINYASNL